MQQICLAVLFENFHGVADIIPSAMKVWTTIGYGFSLDKC